jgi:transcriptional/translational regulatory protein YebC/TACO1
VFASNTDYAKTRQALVDAFGEIDFDVDEIQYLPKGNTPISGEDLEMFNKFIDMLNDLDDVQNIYHDAAI